MANTKTPPKEEEKKYEFVLTEAQVAELDGFFGVSLACRKQGVLDADKAFTHTIDLLRSKLEKREIK